MRPVAALRRLLALLGPYRGWMLGGAGLALLAALAAIGLMVVSGGFIAAMALAGASGAAIDYYTPAAAIRAFAILRTGGRYGERLVTHEATLRGLAGLRSWLFRRLIPLAPARLSALRSGELFARLRADVDALEHAYLALLVPAATALFSLLGVLALSSALLPSSALVLLLGAVLAGVVLPAWAHRHAAVDGARAVQEAALLRGLMLDALRGHAELLAWGGVETQAERIAALAARLDARRARIERLQSLGSAAVALLAQFSLLGVLAFGFIAVQGGALSAPQLVMLALLTLAAFELLAPLPEALAQWQATVTAAQRVFDLADVAPAFDEPAVSAALAPAPEIRFEGVRLRYANDAPWALDGADLTLASGARVAIVGASGSGKSSLLAALQKFYPLQAGQIRFGAQPLAALDGDALRRRIAVIAQQATLFDLSLRDNLLLAAPHATAQQLASAVRAAQLETFVETLPQGLDTILGESGARVSGGEARRIAVARALLQDAPVLVLDEPTEGLDAATARALYAALDLAARGRTLLLVTHRLGGLAQLVDEVVVMASGRIVERVAVATWLEATRACNRPRPAGAAPAPTR